jgi:ketosteroid isomerase-like protein
MKLTGTVALVALAVGLTPAWALGQEIALARKVRRLDREWGEAVVRRDAGALDLLLADDYTFSGPSDVNKTKAEEIAAVNAPAFDFLILSLTTAGVRVRREGRRAVVTGIAELRGRFDGQAVSRRVRYTRAFEERGGRWLIVAARMTSVPGVDD